ncbi:S1 RNA-binding domain-containing protein [Streptomyces solicathayae]|uniref:S1 RNA-binding domain-containing protein n=1 Tax=Streptomyces solicathayae TaxID=3081768 RepID=A0ABZ0LMG3_9ACTN|nr:S1 RNA-binding domain-containing protein [Streptomyces sp. HUAS YS2]WOX20053.1 S1 RNA-binding domain-containing protein [Streptomyces sp. HUAS YS2]
MGAALGDHESREFLAGIRVGDICGGTVAEITGRQGVTVTLDGFSARPLGIVWPLDISWRGDPHLAVKVGQRITAEVTAIDLDTHHARLAMTATENPELWAFLKSRHRGEILSGTIAAIERFGVFVGLDDGPDHPVFPGVGFITIPELSWRRVEALSDVVQVGQRVSCEFLQFDTWHGEARLSLKGTQPDPFQAFADRVAIGQTVQGQVTKLVPFGVFVQVADGVEGLVHLAELTSTPVATPEDAVEAGDEVTVVVTDIDRVQRKLSLSRRQVSSDSL